jgi:hypothetical protein
MASKKILLGIGLLAAAAIVFYAVVGWPPVSQDETSGAIGVAKKYQAEQISEQDVVLADSEIQELLQTDFFYQLVTDPDFQKLYLSGVLEKVVTQVPSSLGGHSVASLTELGRALSDDEVKKHIAAGKFDLAAQTAKTKSINISEKDLTEGFGKGPVVSVAQLDELGRALSDDEVKKHIAAGKFDLAAQTAQARGVHYPEAELSAHMKPFIMPIEDVFSKGPVVSVAQLDELGRALADDEIKKHIAAGRIDLADAQAKKKGITILPGELIASGLTKGPVVSVKELDELGRALADDEIKKHIAAGRIDLADAQAKKKNISVPPQVLERFKVKGLGGHQVSRLNDLGRALSDDEVKKHIAAGKFDLASAAAMGKGVSVNPDELKQAIQGLGLTNVEDMSALGRLLQKESFQKSIPKAGAMEKLLTKSELFKQAVKSGDMAKFDVAMGKKARK